MKVGVMFASTAATTAEEVAELVAVAEDVGVESLWAVEHVWVPAEVRTAYPYTATGEVEGLTTVNLCDPVVWLSFAAARSTRLRLATGILILPQRHPAVVAKEWATLDRLSGGRAMLGVGIGWLVEEMEALGIPFAERAARTDEAIEAIRSLWADGPSTFDGRFHRWERMISLPKPVQAGGVPIVVGGHAPAAARRAARLGDGFFWPGRLSGQIRSPGDDDGLAAALNALAEECGRLGRDRGTLEVTTGANRPTREEVDHLRSLGVDRIVVAAPSRANLRRRLEDAVAAAS